MIIRESFHNEDIWNTVQTMFPNEDLVEIETWKQAYFRVLVKAGSAVECYMVDLGPKRIIYKEGDWVQVAGQYLKVLRGGKEGLIDVEEHFNPRRYTWHQIIPCSYSKIIDYLDDNGMIRVINDGRWGIIDLFNQIVVPIKYNHLSPIYPLVDGRFRVIAKEELDAPEFNLYISKTYMVEVGNWDVPRLTGEVVATT